MKYLKGMLLTAAFFLATPGFGQNRLPIAEGELPPTRIEALESSQGVLLLKSFSEIGSLRTAGGVVVIEALDLLAVKSQKHEFGVVLEFPRPANSRRDGVAYVDYEEIDALLQSMDELARSGESQTRLPNFEASYTTRDDISFKVFNRQSGEISSSIEFERGIRGSINLSLNDFAKARQIIANAKLKLDSLKQ
jgi:hypothetical protein